MSSSPPETDPSAAADPERVLVAEGAPEHDLLGGQRLRLVLGALMLTLFLAALDQTIVSTALPRITSDLGGLNQLAWVVTAYLLASTASTPIWGKISDIYGRKLMLQSAIVIFLVGSALAGASTSMGWLIVTRGIQGLGGGGLMVLVMAVIADVIPPRERGRYTGLFGAVFAVASVVGPLLGGWLVETLSWRWIFYINIPLGIAAFFVLASVLHIPQHRVDHRVDYIGAALMVGGVVLGLLVTEWGGREYAWTSPTILLMAAGSVLLLVAFVRRQLRVPEPLVPMSLFRNKVFGVSSLIGFIVGLAMFGAIIFLPLYLQVVQGASPTQAGLQMIPMMLGLLSMSIISGRLISRFGRYKVFPIIGTVLATVALLLFSTLQVDTPYWKVALAMFVLGAGLGNVMQVLVIAVQNSVDQREIGVATSGTTFFRTIGGTFGTAVFGAVMTSQLASHLAASLPAGAAGGLDPSQLTSAMSTIAGLPAQVQHLVLTAFSDSLAAVFLTAVPVMVVAVLLALVLPEVRLRGTHDRPSVPAE
ncbi:MAG: MDR family MFS transporter [Candidatus Nanopelagicales bacterium]